MCKEVEKVLEESANMTPLCTVLMNGKDYTSEDFVCVMAKDNGDASIFYNTDAITLGIAMRMITKSLVDMLSNMSEEERESVKDVLGDILFPNSTSEEKEDE